MGSMTKAPRSRQSKVRKPVSVASRRGINPAVAGRALQDHLDQQLRGEGQEEEEEEEEEEEDEGDEDADAEAEDLKASPHDPDGHDVELDAQQKQQQQHHHRQEVQQLHHSHPHNESPVTPTAHHHHHHQHHHHPQPDDHQLQLLQAAESLANGGPSVLAAGPDPSIHPALQALAPHPHPFAMDAPPPGQPGPPPPQQVHQQAGGPMQDAPAHQQPHGHMQQQHQQLQQHQLQLQHQHQHHAGGPGRTAEYMARESGYPDLTIDSALSKRLARDPGLRQAMQRREEQVLNLKRRSNVEALLAHVSGQITASPCKNCHKGHGPWSACVVVDGQMCGSCANCWYNASGARCSFHEVRNPQAAHQPAVLPNPVSSFNMPPMAAAALSQGLMQGGMAPAPFSYDPQVKYIVENAIASARAADKRQRLLSKVEVAAKQLALSIAQYEEYVQSEEGMAQQDAQGGGPSGPDASMTEEGGQ